MSKAIEFEKLVKSYNGRRVLDEVSFSVQRGETCALLGVNGAGKTTALECLEGLRRPDSGSIRVLDKTAPGKAVQKLLGVQLQSTSLPDAITPPEAMRLFCAWHKAAFRADLLTRFGMDEYAKKQYAQLSTGRKRRLHLALALCHDPQVLILDEPTAGLDVEGRRALHDELRQLKQRGVTILLATHDMDEAESLSDNIAFLREGRVVLTGPPLELTARASANSRILLKTRLPFAPSATLGQAELLESGYIAFASSDVEHTLYALLEELRNGGNGIVDLRVERASLEDLFISIANGGGLS